MPVSKSGRFASLESVNIPTFELSTKDFENAFIFNDSRLPTTYNDYDTPISSRSSRSSIATPPSSPIISSRPYSSSSRSTRSSRSSSLTFSSPTSATAEPLSRSSSQRSLTATVNTTDVMRSRLSPVAEVVPAVVQPFVPRPSLDDASATSASTSEDEDALPPLPRYFSITTSKEARAAATAAAVKRRSLVIASSPWTCLEDAHHPLCTGECVTAAAASAEVVPASTPSTIAPDVPPTFTSRPSTSPASVSPRPYRQASMRSNTSSPAIPKRRSSVFVAGIARAASAFGQAYASGSVDGEAVKRRVSQ